MQLSIKPTLAFIAALLTLSACESTGPRGPSYETLDSTKDVTSTIRYADNGNSNLYRCCSCRN